jgi:GNAT superfamily N-acetyltransferase
MSIVSRAASLEDLPAILALYAQLSPGDLLPDVASGADTWQRILASEMISVLVVEYEGRVVATCKLVVVPNLTRNQKPFAIIENVVSEQAMRGLGFGKCVIHAAFEQAWAAGCYKIMLMTGRSDPAVLAFYESCCFQRGKTAFQIRRPAGM